MKKFSFLVSFSLVIFLIQSKIRADNKIPDRSICGLQNPIGDLPPRGSAVAVYKAVLGQFPWAANIIYEYRNIFHYYCSGFLINSRYVVSAAGCFANQHSANIRHILLGEYHTYTDIDCTEDGCSPMSIQAEIEEYVLHENFTNDSSNYNIALIRLKFPVDFTKFVAPICLPSVITEFQDSKPNDEVLFSALGSTGYTGYFNDEKVFSYGTIMDNKICSDLFSSGNFNVSEKHICIDDSNNVCHGFRGSAVMKQIGSNWVAEGVVIRDDTCGSFFADVDIFPVALKVSHFEDWIKRNMKP